MTRFDDFMLLAGIGAAVLVAVALGLLVTDTIQLPVEKPCPCSCEGKPEPCDVAHFERATCMIWPDGSCCIIRASGRD